jgi:hypothetical protein
VPASPAARAAASRRPGPPYHHKSVALTPAAGNRNATQNQIEIAQYNRWGILRPDLALDGVFLDVSARLQADTPP